MNKSFEKRLQRNEMNNTIKTNKTTNELTYTYTSNNNNNYNINELIKNINEKDSNINIENLQYLNKVEILEFLIDIIKKYSYNKIKDEIMEKNKEKKELENNINILTSKINNIKIQKKNFNHLSKSIQNEKSRIDKNLRKVSKDLYCENDLSIIKNEINILLNKVKKEKDELTNININISEIKREIHLNKDEIKKYNNIIRQQKIENDIYINSIRLLYKHIILIKEKINKQNGKSNDFFVALTNLAIKSKQCDMQKQYLQKINKRAKSCKGTKKNVFYNFNFL